MTKRSTVAAAAAALSLGLFPAVAPARSFTIETGEYVVKQLGPLKTRSSRYYSPTVGRAINAFGRPSSRFHRSGGCVVKWRRLGLRIEFYSFGHAPSEDRCAADVGQAQSFTITGSKKWRTSKGLRIGMSEEDMWDRHPNAEQVRDDFYPDGYWLRQAYSPFGDGAYYPVLSVQLSPGGNVKNFYGWIGAAGE